MSRDSSNGNNDSKLLKDKFSCIHIENYKAHEGLNSYKIVHSLFVSCQTKEHCANKAKECECKGYSCKSKYERLHGCLYCAFFGCLSKHIQDHSDKYDHRLAIDINSGHVYCFECKDYKYDNEFEEIAKEQNLIAAIQRSDLDQKYKLISTMKQNEALFKLYPSGLPGKTIPDSPVNEITGLRGIVNMGNTCYMNVILQSLLHAPILRDHFLSDKHSKTCNVKRFKSNQETSDHSTVCFSCELGKIVQEFYCKTSNEVYIPHEFLFLVWKHADAFKNNNMHCAHEFLIALLKLLHKDCKESSGNKYEPEHYANCIMEKIFTGVSRLDITCEVCKTTKENIQVFNDISLIIDDKLDEYEELKLQDCLKRLTEPTQEGYRRTCDICESQEMCSETTKFRKLPIIIIFRNQQSKIMDFPEALDMTPFVSYCKNGSSAKLINCNKYHLFAAVHYKEGTTKNGGHYECYIRMHDKRWYHCNDTNIVSKPFIEIKKIPMSLLFYHQEYLQYNVGNMLKEQVKGS